MNLGGSGINSEYSFTFLQRPSHLREIKDISGCEVSNRVILKGMALPGNEFCGMNST